MTQQLETTAGEDAEGQVIEEIMGLERQRAEAYTSRDARALRRLLPDDFTFTREVGSFGKRELIAIVESGDITFESTDRQYDSVKRYGNAALVTGLDAVKGYYRGSDFSGQYRFSNMYVCSDGRWQVVMTHATKLQVE